MLWSCVCVLYLRISLAAEDHGAHVQRLGFYDPLKKETNLNAPAIKKWLDVGAQPSDTVRDLLKRAMVMD